MFRLDETIVHVPHSGLLFPEAERQFFLPDNEDLDKKAFEIADIFADRIYDIGCDRIVAPYSRLLMDVERYDDDDKEVMASAGLGAVYVNFYDGTPLRSGEDSDYRKRLFDEIYYPHHRRLTEMVLEKIKRHGRCLIIDGHSFSPRPFLLDLDLSEPRPDVCIGTDSIHTPQELKEKLIEGFSRKGYVVKENSPYSGTIVPIKLYGDTKVSSVMIELNKKLYMDGNEKNDEKIAELRCQIQEILNS